jgi:transposase-like protein
MKLKKGFEMQTRYSKTFKMEAVKKVLSHHDGTKITEVARDLGLPTSTLYGWVKAMKGKDKAIPLTSEGSCEKKPCQWTTQEKFDAILETAHLSKEAVSEYCRKKGIFPYHVQAWHKEFRDGAEKKVVIEKAGQIKALKEENKQLSKELLRKEKALAEAAALLVLKKKADDYWDLKEDS